MDFDVAFGRFLISGPDAFRDYLSDKLGNEFGVNVFLVVIDLSTHGNQKGTK